MIAKLIGNLANCQIYGSTDTYSAKPIILISPNALEWKKTCSCVR